MIVVWLAALLGAGAWSNSDGALVLAVVATLLAGVLVASWWLLLAPLIPAIYLLVLLLADPAAEFGDGISAWDWVMVVGIAGAATAALLGVGVLIRPSDAYASSRYRPRPRGRSGEAGGAQALLSPGIGDLPWGISAVPSGIARGTFRQ